MQRTQILPKQKTTQLASVLDCSSQSLWQPILGSLRIRNNPWDIVYIVLYINMIPKHD